MEQKEIKSAMILGDGLSETILGWADVGLVGTIRDIQRQFLTATQQQAKYGTAADWPHRAPA